MTPSEGNAFGACDVGLSGLLFDSGLLSQPLAAFPLRAKRKPMPRGAIGSFERLGPMRSCGARHYTSPPLKIILTFLTFELYELAA